MTYADGNIPSHLRNEVDARFELLDLSPTAEEREHAAYLMWQSKLDATNACKEAMKLQPWQKR